MGLPEQGFFQGIEPRETLVLLPPEGIQISTDARFPYPYCFRPGQETTALVTVPDDILPASGFQSKVASDFNLQSVLWPELKISVKSRLALGGLHAELDGFTVDGNNNPLAELTVFVLGGRPIQVKAGDGCACFFTTAGAKLLTGAKLVETMNQQQDLKINNGEGRVGEDWFYVIIRDEENKITDEDL